MFTQGRVRVIALAAADTLCIFASWAVSVCGYWLLGRALHHIGVDTPIGGYSPADYLVFWPVALMFLSFNALFDLYHGNWMYPAAPLSPVEEMRRMFGSSALTHLAVLAYLVFAYQTTVGHSRVVILFSALLTAFGAQSFRNWARWAMFKLGAGQMPVVLAGGGDAAVQVVETLAKSPYYGMKVVGWFEGTGRPGGPRRTDQDKTLAGLGLEYLGTLRDIVAESKKRDIKMLLACMDERLFRHQMEDFATWFTYIDYLPTAKAFPIFGARAVSFDGIGGLEMINQGRMRVRRFQKRVLDDMFALVACIVFLPAFILIPAAIKLTSRGPVFYRHRRLGRDGREIRVWKFRSMYADADARLKAILAADPAAAREWESSYKLKRDPRVTPFGRFLRKTSLDELPQFFNVFSGEMALIGPRPIVEGEVERYGSSYKMFSSVRPGITGLWQVSGRSDTDYARRVALDSYYVLNWSPWMDVWILVRTVFSVLLMRGAR